MSRTEIIAVTAAVVTALVAMVAWWFDFLPN
jgi:hypothetical protein